jgi:predicted signal transduction protein with EAL and GGDEF domain
MFSDFDQHAMQRALALAARGLAPSELMGNADMAMRSAKRRGCGRTTLFEPGMRRRAADRLARESGLRRVVAARRLAVHYQPIVDLRTGAVGGLEALARWPEIRAALQALAGRVTADDMRSMNQAVDGQHRDVTEVVREFRRHQEL